MTVYVKSTCEYAMNGCKELVGLILDANELKTK